MMLLLSTLMFIIIVFKFCNQYSQYLFLIYYILNKKPWTIYHVGYRSNHELMNSVIWTQPVQGSTQNKLPLCQQLLKYVRKYVPVQINYLVILQLANVQGHTFLSLFASLVKIFVTDLCKNDFLIF